MSIKDLRKAEKAYWLKGRWNIVDGKCPYYCKGSKKRHMIYGKKVSRKARRRVDKALVKMSR